MKSRSSSTIVIGIATLIAVLGVTLLLGVDFWLAIVIAVICALGAQFVTNRQTRQ